MRSTDDNSIEVVRPDGSSFRLIEITGELSALLARAKAVENERDEAIRKASVWEKIALREAKINGARLLNKEVAE